MKKILLISRDYPTSTSGAAIAIYNYVKRMTSFNFFLITTKFGGTKNLYKNVKISTIPRLKRYRYFNAMTFIILSFLRSLPKEFDCIIGHVLTGGSSAVLVKLFTGKPMVSIIYDIDFIEKHVKHYGKINKFFRKMILKTIFLMSDRIVVASNTTKNDILRIFGKHLERKIVVISIGVEVTPFKKLKKPKNRIILFVGGLYRKRGVEYLIEAFRVASKEIKNLELWIIGSKRKNYYSKLSELSKGLNVKFFGRVEDNIFRYYDVCEVLVAPDYHSAGGVSLPIIEASAMGKPVVVSDVFRDCVIQNKTGLVVPKQDSEKLAEALIKLLKDKKLRDRLGTQGKQYTKRFSWETSAKILEKTIQTL